MKIISYYELLKMIKDGNIPQKVNYKITGYLEEYVEYTAQYDRNDFTHYELTNPHREDENIHFYLNENYLESDMYDDSILLLEEEKKIPEKLYKYMEIEEEGCYENILRVYDGAEYEINEDMSFVIDKINSIIDYLKSKGDE